MQSLWNSYREETEPVQMPADAKTDVLIVGGGMAGLLCARYLTDAGVDCAVAEQDQLYNGVTANTTAKITVQHGLIYDKLLKNIGIERTSMYYAAHCAALGEFRRLAEGIDCDFEVRSAFVYSRRDRRAIEREVIATKKVGGDAVFRDRIEPPVPIVGAVELKEQAQFNPVKFLNTVRKGLTVYENTKVREIRGHEALTNRGTIRADSFVIATHFPFMNKYGAYFLKMHQERSYVLAFSGAQNLRGMYVDEAKDGLSFRSAGEFLLIGGGGHRTGKPGLCFTAPKTFANRAYPQAKERYRWAAQDCMTLDSVPLIGRYSPRLPNVYVATGFNKWGMTSSMVAALLLRDLLTGQKNDWESVFSPSRLPVNAQLLSNAATFAAGLLTPPVKRCPHMGCALQWNPQEQSWDCPCHGSRFTAKGELLDNPSTGDLPNG